MSIQQPTRRDFLIGLSALGLLPLAGNVAPFSPPYPDPERTTLIDEWMGRIEKAMDALTKFRETLIEARSLTPIEVDAELLYDLDLQARDAMENLEEELDATEFEEFFEITTGKSIYPIYLEREITKGTWGDDNGFGSLQQELIWLGQENSPEAPRLLALFDAKQESRAK